MLGAAAAVLLGKARDRGHVLVGLATAVANIDEVIHIIRSSADPGEARDRLMAKDWPAGDMIARAAHFRLNLIVRSSTECC